MEQRVGGKSKKGRTYVYLWLIHAVVWQKPAQPWKATILQLKINLKNLQQSSLVILFGLLSLTSSLPSPHQIPSPRLFRLHPFSLCPSLPSVIQLGLPGFLSFPSDCSHPDSGWFKVQSTPFVRGGWHQGRFSFISDSFFLMCICSWEHEKPVAEGFCHQSISWVNQVVRPWSSGGHGLAVVPVNVVICLTATVHTPAVSPMSDCTLNQHILWSSELLSPYTLQMYIKFHRSFPFRRRIHTHTLFFFPFKPRYSCPWWRVEGKKHNPWATSPLCGAWGAQHGAQV